MAKTPEQKPADPELEARRLRDWCVAIVKFMGEASPSELLGQTESAINYAFERRDLRGLRVVSKDIAQWVQGMTSKDQERLDDVLRTQFGRGLLENTCEVRKEIARVLTRGSIANEAEYRLLADRVDDIYADKSSRRELEKINAVLAAYERD